jgi:hypothetical protein
MACMLVTFLSVPLFAISGNWRTGEILLLESRNIIIIAFALHASFTILRIFLQKKKNPILVGELRSIGPEFHASIWKAGMLSLIFLFGIFYFEIQPHNRYATWLIEYFLDPNFKSRITSNNLPLMLTLASLVILITLFLLRMEIRWARNKNKILIYARAASLTLSIAGIISIWDFSITGDPWHYMTNMGPALHIMHGGKLMVDAFSQYGPGPVIVNLVAMKVFGSGLATSIVVVQAFNLAYFIAILLCIYRTAEQKFAATILGLLSILIQISVGGLGININWAPSLLGFRYLIPALMVLAIAYLKAGVRHSIFMASVLFVSQFWSIEAAIITSTIYGGFLVFKGLYDRQFHRLVLDLIWVGLITAFGLLTFSILVFATYNELPRFDYYLGFLSSYNAFSSNIWQLPPNPRVWAWFPYSLVFYLPVAILWTRIFSKCKITQKALDLTLIYRILPFSVFGSLMGLYYVGKGHVMGLLIPFLPFAAIVILVLTRLFESEQQFDISRKVSLVIISLFFIFGLGHAFNSIFHANSAYSLVYNDILFKKGANISNYFDRLSSVNKSPPRVTWYSQKGIFDDTLSALERYDHRKNPASLIIGRYSEAELVYLFTNKWHRWPISNSYSDGLSEPLKQEKLNEINDLEEGDLFILTTEPNRILGLNLAIVYHIQETWDFCPIDRSAKSIIVTELKPHGVCPDAIRY